MSYAHRIGSGIVPCFIHTTHRESATRTSLLMGRSVTAFHSSFSVYLDAVFIEMDEPSCMITIL